MVAVVAAVAAIAADVGGGVGIVIAVVPVDGVDDEAVGAFSVAGFRPGGEVSPGL